VDGPYNLYSSSCDVFKHNEAEFPAGEYLIQGSRGTIAKATHFETGAFSASNNVFVCKSASPTISLKFVYYYLSKTKITDEIAVTSVIPMLTKTLFNEILIPLPPLPIQEQYVKELDENEAKIAEAKASLAELVAASEADARAMIEKLKA
jgi:type I restriction enzyme S subunit